jgi:hypothetical protein
MSPEECFQLVQLAKEKQLESLKRDQTFSMMNDHVHILKSQKQLITISKKGHRRIRRSR